MLFIFYIYFFSVCLKQTKKIKSEKILLKNKKYIYVCVCVWLLKNDYLIGKIHRI